MRIVGLLPAFVLAVVVIGDRCACAGQQQHDYDEQEGFHLVFSKHFA